MNRARAAIAAAFGGLWLGACEPTPATPDAGTCPNDLPQASVCNGPVPTYTTDVAPIFMKSCVSCHGPGGTEYFYPLATYAEVASVRTPVLNQVLLCLMPIPPVPALTEPERQIVLTWLVCGLPN